MVVTPISRNKSSNRNRSNRDFDESVNEIDSRFDITSPSWYDSELYCRLMQAFLDRGVPPNEARMFARESFLSGLGGYNSEWAQSLDVSEAAISESASKASSRRKNVDDLYHIIQEKRMKDVLTTLSGQIKSEEHIVEIKVCEYLSYTERFDKNIDSYDTKPQFALVISTFNAKSEHEFVNMKIERYNTPKEVCTGVFESGIEWNDTIVASKLADVFELDTIVESAKECGIEDAVKN